MNSKSEVQRIEALEEQVEFLKDVLRMYGVVSQLNDSLFQEWKNKKGIFRSNQL